MPIGTPSSTDWTFLRLVRQLHQDCGISGDAPETVVDQIGEAKRLVDWVAHAWVLIQSLHDDWKFQRRSISFETETGEAFYTTEDCGIEPNTFGNWVRNSFRCYLTSTGQQGELPIELNPDYDAWRSRWMIGANRTVQSYPIDIAIMPDDGLALGPKPNGVYTINGDYYLAPILMTQDDDIPHLPKKHSPLIIVHRAMMQYGIYESASEVLADGELLYTTRLNLLEIDQLPQMKMCAGWC